MGTAKSYFKNLSSSFEKDVVNVKECQNFLLGRIHRRRILIEMDL
jgi:hypothetical protein